MRCQQRAKIKRKTKIVQDDGERKKWKNLRKFCLNLQIRDCRQKTFVALNGFCPLSRTPSPHSRFLTSTCPFYISFQVLKVRLIKICKIQPPDLLFLVVFISFYISRFHFSQIFRTLFNIIWKTDFRDDFSFSMDSLNTPPPPPPTLLTAKIRKAWLKFLVNAP